MNVLPWVSPVHMHQKKKKEMVSGNVNRESSGNDCWFVSKEFFRSNLSEHVFVFLE